MFKLSRLAILQDDYAENRKMSSSYLIPKGHRLVQLLLSMVSRRDVATVVTRGLRCVAADMHRLDQISGTWQSYMA